MEKNQWSDQLAEKTLASLMQKSATEPEFRKLCLEDPRAAVQQIAGFELPADFKLNIVENKKADLTVVLPDFVPATELNDDQLEEIAGGGGCLVGTCGGTQVCGAISSYCLFTCGGSAISP